MKRPLKLSATFCARVRVPGTYGDGRGGHGLALKVKRTANGRLSKKWAQRLRLNGRPVDVELGFFPVITLAEARAKALENRRLATRGEDPRSGGVPTFREACETVIRLRAKGWKNVKRSTRAWWQPFEAYAWPRFGAKPVSEVTSADVLAAITPIWFTKPVQARRLHERISVVLRWACATGYRTDDPSAGVLEAPPSQQTPGNFTALRHSEVGDALRRIAASQATLATKLAIRFLTLTAARSGEVRGARWSEINGDVWTLAPERTKQHRRHRVPLSRQVLDVLAEAEKLPGGSGLVFPSAGGGELSSTTLCAIFGRLDIPGTPQGMRSAFRSWAADQGFPRDVVEAHMAHIPAGIEAVYHRSDLFDARREVMQRWADYLQMS